MRLPLGELEVGGGLEELDDVFPLLLVLHTHTKKNWILVYLIKWKTDYSIIIFLRDFIIFNLVHVFLKFRVWMPIYMHFSKLPLQMDPKLEFYLLTTFVPWVLKSSSLSRGPPSVGGGGTCPADRPSTPARYPATTQIERSKRNFLRHN